MIDFGRGVTLGPLHAHDKYLPMQWRNDPKIWKWCRQNDVISTQAQEAWFERQAKDPSIKMYMIEAEGKSVGVAGLTSIDLWNRRAEFSLYIAPGFQGLGYGSKALQTLFDHGFRNLGLNCIWGETFEGNPAARIFEKLGVMKEGTRRAFYFRDGKHIDAHLYSVLAKEWLR